MTCVLAIKSKKRLILAGDRAASDGYNQMILARPKIAKLGPKFYVGASGSFRNLQIATEIELDKTPETDKEYEYLLYNYIPALQERLSSLNAMHVLHNVATMPGSLIAIVNGKIFGIQDDLSILEPVDDYLAIGSGTAFASGALYATDGKPLRQRAEIALNAAAYLGQGISPPFDFIEFSA